jgi:hypothetical protein
MKARKSIVTTESEFRLQRQSITPAHPDTRQELKSSGSQDFSEH